MSDETTKTLAEESLKSRIQGFADGLLEGTPSFIGPNQQVVITVAIVDKPQVVVHLSKLDDRSIYDLGLSLRAANCLHNMELDNVGQVRKKTFTPGRKKRIRNLGKRSFREICEKFHSLGIKLDWERWIKL